MKKIILFLLILLNFNCFSQGKEYPIFDKDPNTGQMLVIMTLEQAQKLDNKTDLTDLFKNVDLEETKYDSACIKIVDTQNQEIAEMTIQISDLKSDNSIKTQEISNLQNQITNFQKDLQDCNKQFADQDQIIKDQKKIIKKQKLKMIVADVVGGLAIIGSIILLTHH